MLLVPPALAQSFLLHEAFLASLPFPFLELLKTGPPEQHSSYFSVLGQLGVHTWPVWLDIKAQRSRGLSDGSLVPPVLSFAPALMRV